MSQKLYRHVLLDAWSVTWRHPALWVLGAFALFMGQSQFFYSLGGLFKITSLAKTAAFAAAQSREWFLPVVSPNSWSQAAIGIAISLACVIAVALFTFMVIQSQGAIMSAGDYIFRKRLYSFKAAWHAASAHFWSIVGVLVIKIIAAVVIAAGIYAIQTALDAWPDVWWPKVLFIGGFVALSVIDILVTFVALYATCYVVLEKQRAGAALKHALKMFGRHWLASLEVGVIFLIANVVAAAIAKLVFAILFVPLLYFAVLMRSATGLVAPIVVVNLTILFGAVWFIAAIYTTWFYMSIV